MAPVRKLSLHLLPKISSDITGIWKRERKFTTKVTICKLPSKSYLSASPIDVSPEIRIGSNGSSAPDIVMPSGLPCLTKSYLSESPIDVSPEIRIGSNGSSVPDMVMPSGLPCLSKSYHSESPIDVSPEIRIGSNGSSVPDIVMPSGLQCLSLTFLGVPLMWVLR